MWDVSSYTVSIALLPRLLGFIYFFAVGAFYFQFKGLLGENGILPISQYLSFIKGHFKTKKFFYVPSIFWISSKDLFAESVVIFGVILSFLTMIGFFPILCLSLLLIIYLSIISVGQDFLSFGWEGFLIETTFYTILINLTSQPNLMMWICLNLLLFRFHFQAGAVKFQSHDVNWKNMTALAYHYLTQPLPNTQAWYIYRLPLLFHKFSTCLMFVIELIIPFLLFLTQDLRMIAGLLFIGLQFMIWFTGNFSFLNHLTVALSVIALSDDHLSFIGFSPKVHTDQSFWLLEYFVTSLGVAFTFFQLFRFWDHFYPNFYIQKFLSYFSPFHLVNRYGIFAIMTTKRHEIIIEGSMDGIVWKEYLCRYKPSEIDRRPRRISPYQPRLDWQLWFLPFYSFDVEPWFQQLLTHLLKGTPEVVKLFRFNPFEAHPPKYIRALKYDYVYSSKEERKINGCWWKRKLIGSYSPLLMLKEPDFSI